MQTLVVTLMEDGWSMSRVTHMELVVGTKSTLLTLLS
jgi:hypothetical protein